MAAAAADNNDDDADADAEQKLHELAPTDVHPPSPSPPVLFAHVGEDTKAKIEKQLIHSSSRITRFTLGRDEWRGILNLMAMPLPRNSSFFAMQYFLLWNEFERQNKRMIDQRPKKKKKR